MTIDFYYMSGSPPCRAVLMTAKHLNIKLNHKNIDLLEFLKVNEALIYFCISPCQTVPLMIDQDFVLWESRAIMQYLCDKYSPDCTLYPKNPKKRAIVDKWLYIDMTFFNVIIDTLAKKLSRGIEPTKQQMEKYRTNLQLMNTLIGDKHYLAGDVLTIADLSVLSTTTLLMINKFQDLNNYSNLRVWFERLRTELPYYNKINGKVPEEFSKLIKKFLVDGDRDRFKAIPISPR